MAVMAKLKTKKSASKRFKITSRGKVLFRPMHQNHFNAKDTGKQRRQKRRWLELTGAEAKAIRRLLPYA
jgi:large subunit ribosomal protein L35